MIRLRPRSALLFMCIAASGACSDVVADDQISYTLTAVDDKSLPAVIDGAVSGTMTVVNGYLLGAPSENECEYHVQVQHGNSQSTLDGPVFSCTLQETGEIFIRIDIGQTFGSHAFRFQR